MATLESWEQWCAHVNTNPDVEFYQPELHETGSTRPFRPAPVVVARPATAAERPGPERNFLAGLVAGLALSLPMWFALTVLALWIAGR